MSKLNIQQETINIWFTLYNVIYGLKKLLKKKNTIYKIAEAVPTLMINFQNNLFH